MCPKLTGGDQSKKVIKITKDENAWIWIKVNNCTNSNLFFIKLTRRLTILSSSISSNVYNTLYLFLFCLKFLSTYLSCCLSFFRHTRLPKWIELQKKNRPLNKLSYCTIFKRRLFLSAYFYVQQSLIIF